MITFMTKRFIQNAKTSCLIFQTLPYLLYLALGIGNLSARNPLDVPACLCKSSTPTNTLSISLYLSLLRYSEEHISQLHRSSFSMYYMSLGQIVQTILVILVFILSLETGWSHVSMRKPWCGMIFLTSPHMTLLRVQGSLKW